MPSDSIEVGDSALSWFRDVKCWQLSTAGAHHSRDLAGLSHISDTFILSFFVSIRIGFYFLRSEREPDEDYHDHPGRAQEGI